jgi:multidrug efflux system membrane fusion protein
LRGQIQEDEAQIEYAKTELDYTTIRAPIAGRVGLRQVDVGNILHAADNRTILVLTQLKPISVIFTVAATSVAQRQLAPGRVGIPAIALAPDDATELDRGSVEIVDNQVDQTTGMIKLKASYPNERLRLWPGDFVHGKLIVDTRHNGLTVPSAALRHGPNGDYVWVVRDDKTVQARGVQVLQNAPARLW